VDLNLARCFPLKEEMREQKTRVTHAMSYVPNNHSGPYLSIMMYAMKKSSQYDIFDDRVMVMAHIRALRKKKSPFALHLNKP